VLIGRTRRINRRFGPASMFFFPPSLSPLPFFPSASFFFFFRVSRRREPLQGRRHASLFPPPSKLLFFSQDVFLQHERPFQGAPFFPFPPLPRGARSDVRHITLSPPSLPSPPLSGGTFPPLPSPSLRCSCGTSQTSKPRCSSPDAEPGRRFLSPLYSSPPPMSFTGELQHTLAQAFRERQMRRRSSFSLLLFSLSFYIPPLPPILNPTPQDDTGEWKKTRFPFFPPHSFPFREILSPPPLRDERRRLEVVRVTGSFPLLPLPFSSSQVFFLFLPLRDTRENF